MGGAGLPLNAKCRLICWSDFKIIHWNLAINFYNFTVTPCHELTFVERYCSSSENLIMKILRRYAARMCPKTLPLSWTYLRGGGPLFPVWPVGILVEWIAPLVTLARPFRFASAKLCPESSHCIASKICHESCWKRQTGKFVPVSKTKLVRVYGRGSQ